VTRGFLSNKEYKSTFYAFVATAIAAYAPSDDLSPIEVSRQVLYVVAATPGYFQYSAHGVRTRILLEANRLLNGGSGMVRTASITLEKHFYDRLVVRVRFRKFSLLDML
jgi:hypothetical protein